MSTTVVVDPSTNQPISEVPRHSPDGVDRALDGLSDRLLCQNTYSVDMGRGFSGCQRDDHVSIVKRQRRIDGSIQTPEGHIAYLSKLGLSQIGIGK